MIGGTAKKVHDDQRDAAAPSGAAQSDDDDHVPAEVARLREEITAADAVLFCTPEYAGTLPGSFTSLPDWTVGGGQLYGRSATRGSGPKPPGSGTPCSTSA